MNRPEPAAPAAPRPPRVVLLGAGFAGVQFARTLAREMRRDELELTVFNRDNHMVFQPLLADVAGSSLNPRAVAAPLRQLLPHAEIRSEEVLDIDLELREVVHAGADGRPRRLPFDHLVIACGNQVNLNLLPGMAAHALPLKTIGDALALRARVMAQLEQAAVAEDAELRRRCLSFVVIGGGFSGVEVAGELMDLVQGALRYYPQLQREEISVRLLHSGDRLLPELNERLGRFTERRMRAEGVEVRLGSRAAEISAQGVVLKDGERLPAATVICTIGTTQLPLLGRLDLPQERGRLRCEADMHVSGQSSLWAMGDCAHIPNAQDGQISPPTAQFAERQGRQCARNLLRQLRGEATQPFRFRAVGAACGIGARRGVAELWGWRFSGFLAWWLWRSAFLVKLPSLSQKLKVGLDWAWELVFPRDVSHFRSEPSEPVQREHYVDGEVLLRSDSQRMDLVAIEQGEVHIRSRRTDGNWVDEAAYGAGTLLGRVSLEAFAADEVEVVARGPVEVVRLPEQVLGRVADLLAPFDAIVQRAAARPERVIWRHHPAAMAALRERTVDELMSPLPPMAEHDLGLGESYRMLASAAAPALLVTRQGRLLGLATRSDLLTAFSRGATRHSPLADATNLHAQSATLGDNAAALAEIMAAEDLKLVPVCDAQAHPVGVVLADDIVLFALGLPRAA
ncbi:MAG: FAD-dependent oxidoreductase [Xanthomonadales bacterium]|nr:FAD-dependent oxidoreductase [Xanthomonadales bacterium]